MTRWYVLQCKRNKEDSVLQQLIVNNIDAYYPCIKVRPVNPRSRKTKPYFPGYIFVNANLDVVGTSILQWIPGVIGLVSFGGELASVPDDLLQAIQSYANRINSEKSEPQRMFVRGEKVVIQSGPFAGFHAIFDSYLPGYERVRVLLQMLRDRQLKVELSGMRINQLNIYPSHN